MSQQNNAALLNLHLVWAPTGSGQRSYRSHPPIVPVIIGQVVAYTVGCQAVTPSASPPPNPSSLAKGCPLAPWSPHTGPRS
eukprot:4380736-Amphidinium_carterae.3